MANKYIANNVVLTEATIGGPGRLLLTGGTGTFTVVSADQHVLELTSGKLVSAFSDGDAVNAEGIATVRPPAIGAFPIQETMSTKSAQFPMVFEGPIFLAAGAGRQSQAAAAQ
jgi:hypothetical protein